MNPTNSNLLKHLEPQTRPIMSQTVPEKSRNKREKKTAPAQSDGDMGIIRGMPRWLAAG